jgi:D-alanyl-lipoteichoic acid acyltransferase DltB (MBOAT superfamily)
MLFNSIEYAIFLPIVFILYWFVFQKNLEAQNIFIVIVSYIFYGWWDWRFLSLIIFSSVVDYFVGLGLLKTENGTKRKILLYTSLITNLGLLGVFKYYNFFIDSLMNAAPGLTFLLSERTLNIVLPVGISFYTFQTLSYTIDVYRKKLKPTKDFFSFFAYVSFFPQLVAGPIERATNLLPQFQKRRSFNYDKAQDGLRQILWGLFKKIVIADNAAIQVNYIFNNYESLSGSMLLLGVFYFAFQIYCDFSGYSDIAIGSARLFGFDLMRNFAYPYFSRDIAEFWRRWHISLSTWFRDYLYIPLGGSKGSLWNSLWNVLLVFTVSGFWHGANWTFIVWGFLNGLYFIPLMLAGKNRNNLDTVAQNSILPSLKEIFQISVTFFITLIAWVFFRAENVSQAFNYLGHMFSASLFTIPQRRETIPLILILIVVEWIQRKKQHGLEIDCVKFAALRWAIYYLVIFVILNFGGSQQQFIYFQF